MVEVLYTDEFEAWWKDLSMEEQAKVNAAVELLEDRGTALGHPFSSGIVNSKHGQMRELRVQHRGHPYRVLYAFDPNRDAILLIGGDKTGNDRWYDEFVPLADRLFDEHLERLEEGV